MKTNKLILVLMTGLLPFLKCYSQAAMQTVKVTNLDNVKGTLYIGWYDNEDDFPINDKAIYREEINVTNLSEVTATFNNIPAGNYAIAVFLDEDDDYKLDRNLIGIPKEKYGFSNNVLPSLRPATFKESSFMLGNEEKMLSIKLK